MGTVELANHIAGVWRPAARGATFPAPGGAAGAWPQSGSEDVRLAREAAHDGARAWRGLARARRSELLRSLALALQSDAEIAALLGRRFGLEPDECTRHAGVDAAPADALGARRLPEECALAWVVPDWRELVRGAYQVLARELESGRAVVLVSDARFPELCERIVAAGARAGLPPGALGLLHGEAHELVAQALAGSAGKPCTLVASGLVERMVEWRRLCEQHAPLEPRLVALRTGDFEVDPARDLERSVVAVLEQAFGRATTLGGQLPGALARVHCPARHFSRFSQLFLEALEASAAARAPVPLADAEAAERMRSALELGLDEGATLVAGGLDEETSSSLALAPCVFTNVEPFMACAQRQDPLPILCLLRAP